MQTHVGARYRTVFAGKWHAGMALAAQTPRMRGYDAALSYFAPDNDQWAQTYAGCPLLGPGPPSATPIVDLWEAVEGGGEGPATRLNSSCSDSSNSNSSGRQFVPFNGCADELGRRCAPAWVQGDRAACERCAAEANISACGSGACPAEGNATACVPPAVARWCQGFVNFTTGVGCKTRSGAPAIFEDDLLADFAVAKIAEHAASTAAREGAVETHEWAAEPTQPLFLFFALHAAHTPLQAPAATLERFDFIAKRNDKPERTRQVYTALVAEGDRVVGRLVDAFRSAGLWESTLHIFLSDNGGPSYLNGTSGANNFPLKGGKMSNFEGGIRVPSFISGGFVPPARRGTEYTGLVAAHDFYAMVIGLAGGNTTDPLSDAAGLPAVDGIDLSSVILFGAAPSAGGRSDDGGGSGGGGGIGGGGRIAAAATERTELVIGTENTSQRDVAGVLWAVPPNQTAGGTARLYKLLTGVVNQGAHSAPISPNGTENASLRFPPAEPDEFWVDCGDEGCLYEVGSTPFFSAPLGQPPVAAKF